MARRHTVTAREDVDNLIAELTKVEANPSWGQGPGTEYHQEVKEELAAAEVKLVEAESLPFLDHVYSGRGIPVPHRWPGVPDWDRSELIGGAFHVKRRLADEQGEFAAILDNGEGSEWIVFELPNLDRVI